jgi:putative two-component system response regulator
MNSIVIEILVQRKKENLDIFKLFEVSSEDIQHIRALLDQTSIQNTEISLQLMAKVENKRQMYDLKLRTLWSPLKKDGYIGIVGYLS